MIKMLLRILYLFISPVILPVALIVFVIYFLGETTIGLQTSIRMASKFLPGELTVQHAQGKLFSEFTLNNITYHSADAEISIQFFDLVWQPKALLLQKLYIQHLVFHDANIKVTRVADNKKLDFNLDKLKFYLQHLRANQISVYNVSYTENNNLAIKLNELRLQQIGAEDFSFYVKNDNGDMTGELKEQWNAHWNLQTKDLSTLIPASRGRVALTGTITGARMTPVINANVVASQLFYNGQSIERLDGKANIILKSDTVSSLSLKTTGLKIQSYSFKKADIEIKSQTGKDKKNWITNLTVALNNNPYMTVLFLLPQNFDLNKFDTEPLYVKLKINLLNIETISPYIPVLKNLHGKILGFLEFKGSIAKPLLSGEAEFSNGNITIPELGITLRNIALHIQGNDSKRLTYSGSFLSDKGTATLHGSTDFSAADFPSTLSLQGKDLQIVNLEDYKIHASPDIQLKLAEKTVTLSGNIFIPDAKITPKNFSSVVTLSSDVVFVGAEKPAAPLFMQYLPSLQINVTLGDKIYLHYQDLEATLKGTVAISKGPNSPATGIGELYATKGTYNAYKKILDIKEGRLVYTGNLITNPGLDIRATRNMKTVQTGSVSDFTTAQAYEGTQNLTVGVQVQGTLEKPLISLYSSPALSQVDVLSYLILGVPSSQASGNNSQALLAAASAINIGGSGANHLAAITTGLKKTFGLSELNVESVQSFDPTANQNAGGVVGKTSLVVGKQIAENLTVHYSTSLDLLNPVSTFNLRYKLSKRFSIQSETSTIDTGADLLYSIERD